MRSGGVENCVVPREAFVKATSRVGLRSVVLKSVIQRRGDEMVRIPKLPHPWVRDPAQVRRARRFPVGGEDGLPDDQHAQRLLRMSR